MKRALSIILLSRLMVFIQPHEAHYYGSVIKAVRDKHRTFEVIIVPERDYKSLGKITIWHEVIRTLSNEAISTIIGDSKCIEQKLRQPNLTTAPALIVIVPDTIEEFYTSISNTKNLHLHMSRVVWLIFFTRNTCEFCRNSSRISLNPHSESKILISCCESPIIEEWKYSGSNRTEKQEVGRLMDHHRGITWVSDDSKNNDKYSIRIVAVRQSSLFSEKEGKYYGFLGEILEELSQVMNFTVKSITWKDDYGVWNSQISNWTGAIGSIIHHETDIGISDFTITPERSSVISFTFPFASGGFHVYFEKHSTSYLLWNAYFKPLRVDVWIVVIGFTLITPLLFIIIDYDRSSFLRYLSDHQRIWGIYCQQGLPAFPTKAPAKIIYTSIFLSALINSVAYSASMISSLAVGSYTSFQTIHDFINDGTYKLIVIDSSQPFDMYELSDKQLTKKMVAAMKSKASLPRNNQEGFQQVCNERVGFYIHEMTKKAIQNSIPCDVTSVQYGEREPLSLVMRQDSEYLEIINHYFALFKSNGMFQRLEYKYYKELKVNESHYPSVSFRRVIPLLFILATGFILSIIILLIERIFHPQNKPHDKKRQIHFLE